MKIRHHLKKALLPSRHNQYHPHLIRHWGLIAVLTSLMILTTLTNYLETGKFQVLGYATDVTSTGLFSQTNIQRQGGGLATFVLNGLLVNAAQQKANHMITNDYWAHVAPDGTTPWYFIDGSGYLYLKAGENLAYGFLTNDGVIQGWMDSAGHRANIMDLDFQDVGFGIANGSNYQGDENTVVVAMYGQPLPQTIPAVPAYQPEPQDTQNEPEASGSADTVTIIEEEPVAESAEIPENITDASGENLRVVDIGQYDQEVFVRGPVLAGQVDGHIVSNFEALITGRATPSMYATIGLLLLVGLIYLFRHLKAMHQFIVHGAHSIKGHPMLEASLVYLVIWMILRATYGVVL